ncbi:hypothetical protein D3C80_1510700 [compost metagenome]
MHRHGPRDQRHLLHAAHLHADISVEDAELQRGPWRPHHHRGYGWHAVRPARHRAFERPDRTQAVSGGWQHGDPVSFTAGISSHRQRAGCSDFLRPAHPGGRT